MSGVLLLRKKSREQEKLWPSKREVRESKAGSRRIMHCFWEARRWR